MPNDDLNDGQTGGQSTEFANQGQNFGQGQSGQPQSFSPQPDPGVGTEDLTDGTDMNGGDGEDDILDRDDLDDEDQTDDQLGDDSILPPADTESGLGGDNTGTSDGIDPLTDSDSEAGGQSAA